MITMYICRWRLGVVSLTALTDAGVYVSVNLPGIIVIIIIIINIILSIIKSPSSVLVIIVAKIKICNLHN